jgi:hypothetical protein
MDASIHNSPSADSPNNIKDNILYTIRAPIDKKIKPSMAIMASNQEAMLALSNSPIHE